MQMCTSTILITSESGSGSCGWSVFEASLVNMKSQWRFGQLRCCCHVACAEPIWILSDQHRPYPLPLNSSAGAVSLLTPLLIVRAYGFQIASPSPVWVTQHGVSCRNLKVDVKLNLLSACITSRSNAMRKCKDNLTQKTEWTDSQVWLCPSQVCLYEIEIFLLKSPLLLELWFCVRFYCS